MKGNPLVRLAAVILVLGAMLWPVMRLTRRMETPTIKPPGDASSPALDSKATSLRSTLLLHATPSPLHCAISQHGVILLTEKDRTAIGEYRAAAEITPGEDLVISAQWENTDPHAVRAEVQFHGSHVPLEKTFWARQSLEDTLSVPEYFLP